MDVATAIQNLRNDSMVLDSPSKRLDVLAAYAGGQLAGEPQPSRHRPAAAPVPAPWDGQDSSAGSQQQQHASKQRALEAALEEAFESHNGAATAAVAEARPPRQAAVKAEPGEQGPVQGLMGLSHPLPKQQRSPRKQQQVQRARASAAAATAEQLLQHEPPLLQQQPGSASKRPRVDVSTGSNSSHAASPVHASTQGPHAHYGYTQMGPHGQQYTCSLTEHQCTHDGYK